MASIFCNQDFDQTRFGLILVFSLNCACRKLNRITLMINVLVLAAFLIRTKVFCQFQGTYLFTIHAICSNSVLSVNPILFLKLHLTWQIRKRTSRRKFA
jgi:hypothetical protein